MFQTFLGFAVLTTHSRPDMTTVKTHTETTTPEYGYLDSFKHWWGRGKLDQAEYDILSTLPFFPDSDGKRVATVINVPIGKKEYVHEFNVKNIEDTLNEKHVVLVHGYGAALGLFIRNFGDLTEKPGANLHALDLLGYGLSSRPKLPKFDGNSMDDVLAVEGFFLDSIEAWRKSRDIEKFNLIGHSFGGYLSTLYALKYPEHVEKLVLVSPVGVELSKFDLSKPQPETINTPSSLTEEVNGPDIEQEVGLHHNTTDKPVKTSSSLHVPDANGYVDRVPNLPRVLGYLWKHNMSPFSLMRAMGPLGPSFASRWSFRRFSFIDDEDLLKKMHVYCYGTFVGKASGEYALTRILAPGALGRYPLLSRVPGNLKMSSLWMYGDVDWMSKEAGKTIVDKINEKEEDGKADFTVLRGAGHHVYLDNPQDFKTSVFKFFGW